MLTGRLFQGSEAAFFFKRAGSWPFFFLGGGEVFLSDTAMQTLDCEEDCKQKLADAVSHLHKYGAVQCKHQ